MIIDDKGNELHVEIGGPSQFISRDKLEEYNKSLQNMYSCEVKSVGFDEAYQKHLEAELKYTKQMMWWAFAGWIWTIIFYNL